MPVDPKPISSEGSILLANLARGWGAPIGFAVRAIAYDANGNGEYVGDYGKEEGAHRDMRRRDIGSYRLFDQGGCQVYSSF